MCSCKASLFAAMLALLFPWITFPCPLGWALLIDWNTKESLFWLQHSEIINWLRYRGCQGVGLCVSLVRELICPYWSYPFFQFCGSWGNILCYNPWHLDPLRPYQQHYHTPYYVWGITCKLLRSFICQQANLCLPCCVLWDMQLYRALRKPSTPSPGEYVTVQSSQERLLQHFIYIVNVLTTEGAFWCIQKLMSRFSTSSCTLHRLQLREKPAVSFLAVPAIPSLPLYYSISKSNQLWHIWLYHLPPLLPIDFLNFFLSLVMTGTYLTIFDLPPLWI